MHRPSALLFFAVLCAPAAVWLGCGSTTNVVAPPDDAGDTGDDAGDDGGNDGLAPLVCTSGKTWTNGDRGSVNMHPGRACVTCHTDNGGPTFDFGGTVYPTAHEPNDCDGVNGSTLGLSVVITGADNQQYMFPVNSVGNFNSGLVRVMMPFHAYVASGCTQAEAGAQVDCTGKIRGMVEAQKTGDCNSCHTEQGTNSAPGRIQAP